MKLIKFKIRSLNQIHVGERRRIKGENCFVWTWFGPMCRRTLYVEEKECEIIEEPYKTPEENV